MFDHPTPDRELKGAEQNSAASIISNNEANSLTQNIVAKAPKDLPAGFPRADDIIEFKDNYGGATEVCPADALANHPIASAVHSFTSDIIQGTEAGLASTPSFVYNHPIEAGAIAVGAAAIGFAVPEVAIGVGLVAAAGWIGTLAAVEAHAVSEDVLSCKLKE